MPERATAEETLIKALLEDRQTLKLY